MSEKIMGEIGGGETCASFRKYIDPLIRIGDHHMAIEESSTAWHCFAQTRYDRRTDCDVGHCCK